MEATSNTSEIDDTFSLLHSEIRIMGKIKSMKNPGASPFCNVEVPTVSISDTFLAVRVPDKVTNWIVSESTLPEVKRACVAASVA